MELLLGKPVADKIKEDLVNRIKNLKRKPHYVILLNQDDNSSAGYVKSQTKMAEELGISFEVKIMPSSEESYLKTIKSLNNDINVDGVLITRPLFKGADEKKILSELSPFKDIDAVNPLALGKVIMDDSEFFAPATAEAVIRMLKFYNFEITSKRVLVIGRSLSVGKPVAMLLLNENATVTIAHSKTKDLESYYKNHDIIVVAVGKRQLIDASKMDERTIVIDCGMHYCDDGIFGDVKVDDNIAYISKVPGGIGPITSVLLMEHIVCCAEVNNAKKMDV